MYYKIVRYYMNGKSRVVRTGLTREEAQAHCQDPETSSRTCTNAAGRRRTRLKGPWFDGYALDAALVHRAARRGLFPPCGIAV